MLEVKIHYAGDTATGGGFELCLACDFRLLAEGRYRVGLPETSIGIIPGAGGTQRYARLLGTAKALDLILHAKLLTLLRLQAWLTRKDSPCAANPETMNAWISQLETPKRSTTP